MSKKIVKVEKGTTGWGGPFTLYASGKQNVVASVTGGGIDPLAQKIADLLEVPVVDGFNNKVEPENMIVVVTDCGGTARCGVYPKMGVKTIDINAISPSGPLAKFMNEENFCSGCTIDTAYLVEDDGSIDTAPVESAVAPEQEASSEPVQEQKGFMGFIAKMGGAVGTFVNTFYQAGRDSVDMVMRNILPFMAFVSVLVGIINYSGIGNILANAVKPLAGSLPGLIGLSIFCAVPFLSPMLGPGAVIGQIIGVLLGVEIGKGTIPPSYSLPALFAINSQVGCDFIPVALTLAEAEDKTVQAGVPAQLFTRLVTGPIAVLIAFAFSLGLY
ncbi:MAG: PTS glucitol/sorbitol transporter subunit IIB [Anaerostipes sp.]|nr:PTS glucitol/sorbitol transporter subunit IIB [Anaerostipes sp.]